MFEETLAPVWVVGSVADNHNVIATGAVLFKMCLNLIFLRCKVMSLQAIRIQKGERGKNPNPEAFVSKGCKHKSFLFCV